MSFTFLSGLMNRRPDRIRRPATRRLTLEQLEDRIVPTVATTPSGLVSWWTGDGNATDLIGANNGTLNNAVSFTQGEVGSAFKFNGSNYVSASTAKLPTGGSDRTMEMWVKIDAFSKNKETYFAGYGNFGSNDQAYQLGALSDHRLYFSQWGKSITGPTLSTGQWYHIAVTSTNSSTTLYLNGSAVATGSLSINTPDNTSLYIGRIPGSLGDTRNLTGEVDEVSVYSRALSASEIQAINQAGAAGKIKMDVRQTDPAQGSTVTAPPSSYTVDFTDAVNPASVQGSDFLVNGIAADSVALSNNNTRATFTFANNPVTAQVLQTIHMDAGAVTRSSDGLVLNPYDGSFRYDPLAMQVVGTSPMNGGVLTISSTAPTTLQLILNEPVDPGSVGTDDLTLSQGQITGASVSADGTTITYTLANLQKGSVNVSLAAGAIADAYDNLLTQPFSVTYSADYPNDPPLLSVGDINVVEGDSGTLNAVFQLTLSTPVSGAVTVSYSTADGTAKAGSDYTAVNGSLTFQPGETVKTVAVPILGDTVVETRGKTFYLNLTATGTAGYDNQAVGTILDDDYDGTAPINYGNFNSTSGLQLAGSASAAAPTKKADKVLRLTPSSASQAGAAWLTTQQDVQDGFKTTFQFRMSGGADGLAFVIQNSAVNAVGGSAWNMGYGGIPNALAVEFDTWQNNTKDFGSTTGDPNDNHVSVQVGGSAPQYSLGYASPSFNLDDNASHTATIEYVPGPAGSPGVLGVFLDKSAAPLLTVNVDLSTALNLAAGGKAWVGFTAGTGGLKNQTQDILNWQFAPLPASMVAADGAASTGGAGSPALTTGALQPLVQEAVARWQSAGFTPQQTATLRSMDVQIADLGGATLGLTSGNTILIDDNAAGWGWFVDPKPGDDSEFTTPGDQGEQGHMDLLTVLTHEMGHLLGLEHSSTSGDVMEATLKAGIRLMPAAGDLLGSTLAGAPSPGSKEAGKTQIALQPLTGYSPALTAADVLFAELAQRAEHHQWS